MFKKCKDCGETKNKNLFYGVQGECKECSKKRVRKYYNKNKGKCYEYEKKRNVTTNRLFLRKYYAMRQRVLGTSSHKASVLGRELLSKDEFLKWCYSKKSLLKFKKLKKKWEEKGFEKKDCPSIDRIDENESYVLGNLQWITHSENTAKYIRIKKNEIEK